MWIRCSAWPALQAATAPLVVVLLLGSLFLGPQGIEIRDLGQLAESYSLMPVALLILWSLAMAPAGKAALQAQGLRYLRWLPIPTWLAVGLLGLLLFLLHAPFALLFAFAGKPALALALLVGGVGLSTGLLLPNYRRMHSLISLAIGVGIVLLLASRQLLPTVIVGALATLWRLPHQYRQAAQPSRRHMRRALFGGSRVILLAVQSLRLVRCEATALLRAGLLALLGTGLVWAVHRANPEQDFAGITLATLVASTPCFAALAAVLAIALRRGQEELFWLRRSLGISTSRLRASSLLLLSMSGVALALVFTLVVMMTSSGSWHASAPLFGLLAMHAFSWCIIASLLAYRVSGAGKDQSPAMLALCIALLDMVIIGAAGPWALLLELCVALLLASRILGYSANRELRHA